MRYQLATNPHYTHCWVLSESHASLKIHEKIQNQFEMKPLETLVGKFICFFLALLVVGITLPAITKAESPSQSTGKPLRVAIAGLVHGHVAGFLGPALKRSDIQIVGIVEPDQQLAHRYADQYKLDPQLLYSDVEQLLTTVQPQAVLVYTDTRDHRRIVEAAARHRIPVMMESLWQSAWKTRWRLSGPPMRAHPCAGELRNHLVPQQ